MTETRILELHYLGNTKQQPGFDERVAFGHDGSQWAFVFPESVLLSHFSGMTADPTVATTLYGVLGVKRDASQEEIRKAFRAAAKKWHSDANQIYINSDPAFIRIKDAYDILSNPDQRARYDAGLALEATMNKRKNEVKQDYTAGYRPAQRAGYVLAEGAESSRGQFVVAKILDWQPITNQQGQVLHSVWPAGAKTFSESWLQVARSPR